MARSAPVTGPTETSDGQSSCPPDQRRPNWDAMVLGRALSRPARPNAVLIDQPVQRANAPGAFWPPRDHFASSIQCQVGPPAGQRWRPRVTRTIAMFLASGAPE